MLAEAVVPVAEKVLEFAPDKGSWLTRVGRKEDSQ